MDLYVRAATLRLAAGATHAVALRKHITPVAFDQAGSAMKPRERTDPAFVATIALRADIYNDRPVYSSLHQNDVLIGGLAVADLPHDAADARARDAPAKTPL